MKISDKLMQQIIQLCDQHKVKSLAVFGSVTREDFKKSSDIDFLVDFKESDPFKYTDLYFQLKDGLENLLHYPIDLIEERGVKNHFFRKELEQTKIQIYGNLSSENYQN